VCPLHADRRGVQQAGTHSPDAREQRQPKRKPMDNPRIGYVNVFVSDFDRALAFYQDRLGLEPNVQDAQFGYASFQTDGAGFAFARTDEPALVGRHTGIGWVVPDLDQAHTDLLAAGVEFESPPARQPWGGYMAIFQDPDGNLFYLDQPEQG
jgi:predicted enzyme related to lactoylglutathione lyase